MKRLKTRTLFVLFFTALLGLGMGFLLFSYVRDGAYWAAHRPAGSISSGRITDRNGVVLYDYESGTYSDEYEVRTSTIHAVGDRTGSIASGARQVFAGSMSSFNLITGISTRTEELRLSLDSKLNVRAWEAMEGRKGTVGLYNYRTGEVLCMLSTPVFDPEDKAQIEAINSGAEAYTGAYMNRFLSSTYTPGSTFKIVTTAAALETLPDIDDFAFHCTGAVSYGDHSITCPRTHGWLNLSDALADSCNGAFGELANRVGSETLYKYAKEAGLLDRREVSGIKTAAGSFATTGVPIDIGWSGIGQYKDLVNPCAEMTLMGCIAGGGTAAAPRLLSAEGGLFAKEPESTSIGWEPSTCTRLKELMRNNVVNHYGQSQFGDLPVCAKSGTAEVGGDSAPHAWFTGFIDSDEYPYAFVVIIENGGWGSQQAGAVAAQVLESACTPEAESEE
jgi:peptidoglycan glycosyltransferase